MGDEDEAEGLGTLQFPQQVDDVDLGVLVEIARRLVGEQQTRRVDQGTRDDRAALLAARHIAGISLGSVGQADAVEQAASPPIGVLGVHGAAEQRRQRDVVARGQVRQQAGELKDKADMAAAEIREPGLRQGPHIGAVEHQLALRRRGQRAQHRQQGRFARTRAADDRDELAVIEIEAGRAHCLIAGWGAVALGQRPRRQAHVSAPRSGSAHGAPPGAPARPAGMRRRDRGPRRSRAPRARRLRAP